MPCQKNIYKKKENEILGIYMKVAKRTPFICGKLKMYLENENKHSLVYILNLLGKSIGMKH